MKKHLIETDDLRADLYLIGYPEMGESQVFVIKKKNSNIIFFSAVIDCYTENSINKTIEILNEYNIESLDLLCWTHPDDDHSLGIQDIVENFCTNNTKILLPEGIYGSDDDFVEYNSSIINFFSRIKDNNLNRTYNINSTTVFPYQTQGIETVLFVRGLTEIKFQITALAPISAIVRRKISGKLKIKNNISIALLFEFGELALFLTGDIEDQTIRLIASNSLSNLSYLKTPHHTSFSSVALLDILSEYYTESKIPVTCTTAFRKYNLPDEELIEKYKPYTNSFYTTHNDSSLDAFGIIKFEFNPFDNTAINSLLGSARKIY